MEKLKVTVNEHDKVDVYMDGKEVHGWQRFEMDAQVGYPTTHDITYATSVAKHKEIDIQEETPTQNKNTYQLTEKNARKILLLLLNSVYQKDNDFIKTDDDIRNLIDISDGIQWDLAEWLDIDLNDCYIDHRTLETEQY